MGLKVDTIQNPSSSTVNLTLDTSGNATVGNNLTVTGGFTPASSFLRNRLINGGMQIFQRGTNLSTNATSGYYIDRMWGYSGASTAATFSQLTSTSLAGFPYASRAQRNSGNTGTGGVYMGQIIESSNMVDLQGQTVTLSFYARAGANYSAAGNALSVALRTGTVADQGLAALISGWTGTADQTSSVTLTTSWQRFTVNFTMPSNALEASPFWYSTNTGTAGTNDYFDVTGVQLEVGSVATPFERRQYGQELALCQRYYEICGMTLTITGIYQNTCWFRAEKRGGATLTLVGGTLNGGTVAAMNAIAYGGVPSGVSGFRQNTNNAGASDAVLSASAEL